MVDCDLIGPRTAVSFPQQLKLIIAADDRTFFLDHGLEKLKIFLGDSFVSLDSPTGPLVPPLAWNPAEQEKQREENDTWRIPGASRDKATFDQAIAHGIMIEKWKLDALAGHENIGSEKFDPQTGEALYIPKSSDVYDGVPVYTVKGATPSVLAERTVSTSAEMCDAVAAYVVELQPNKTERAAINKAEESKAASIAEATLAEAKKMRRSKLANTRGAAARHEKEDNEETMQSKEAKASELAARKTLKCTYCNKGFVPKSMAHGKHESECKQNPANKTVEGAKKEKTKTKKKKKKTTKQAKQPSTTTGMAAAAVGTKRGGDGAMGVDKNPKKTKTPTSAPEESASRDRGGAQAVAAGDSKKRGASAVDLERTASADTGESGEGSKKQKKKKKKKKKDKA